MSPVLANALVIEGKLALSNQMLDKNMRKNQGHYNLTMFAIWHLPTVVTSTGSLERPSWQVEIVLFETLYTLMQYTIHGFTRAHVS